VHEHLAPELDTLRPAFDAFCARHGFTYASKTSIGRYPRIRVDRELQWIDVWMELDANGQRFVEYSPDLPYELGAGAFLDEAGMRYSAKGLVVEHATLDVIRTRVPELLDRALELLAPWDAAYLRAHGTRSALR
jgi:hypothetical protein